MGEVDDLGMCAEDEAKPMPGIVGLSLLGEGLGVLRRGQDAKSGLGRWPRGGGTCVWGQPPRTSLAGVVTGADLRVRD
jgi:hypothetical protein